VRFSPGWTGVVGANGAGKSTLLRLAVGELSPLAGKVEGPASAVYCPQRTDEPPELLGRLVQAADREACRIRGIFQIEPDWLSRWDTLSHGERKRAQIGVALWRVPSVLALDEPSNHIDSDARNMLLQALASFRGIGLLVSHDRRLLDGLCRQCLFLSPARAELRPGGYTKGKALGEAQAEELRQRRESAKAQHRKIEREMARRRERAADEHKMRSKRHLARGDSDGREKIGRARVADSKGGAPLRQLAGRMDQAREALASIRVIKESKLGIWLSGERSRRDRLFRVQPGRIELGPGGAVLDFPELLMPTDGRVALVGPNGAGKSTLLRFILRRLDLPADRLLSMPQEISADESQGILAQVRALDHDKLGRVLNIVSHLGSEVQPVLETALPSPGEIRKILLALGIVQACHLVVMDEPTNHLDLPSVECMEKALSNCPCGLLLVSHDLEFLRRLTTTRWEIHQVGKGRLELQVESGWR